ncbi:type IV secretory system conjugative DNA transfer family protein [Bdellovibrio sp. NC01]|uniref:type IV secretory system conjugative DNA transfer family protein n=1 Tax=Bdellovibrio sp. NC01 TaxID=2220073 RepID=UPI001159A33C|nr:TraM recognition domain-containing protein [Bdellovibrio sp. NC01]QDK37977.1 hypothetical protein DOE51_10440 [Bdellovibrio sp. NC01]
MPNSLLSYLFSPKEPSIQIGRIEGSFFQYDYLTDGELNHHVHVLGASGFGKTVLINKIMKQRLFQGQGLLWIDLKGDIETINQMREAVKASGRENDLKIFSISHAEFSGTYNFVKVGNATELRDKIMRSLEWSDKFYETQSSSYLLKLFIGYCWLRDNQSFNFDLAAVLEGLSSVEYIADLCVKVPDSEPKVKKALEDCYTYLNSSTTYLNLSGLRSQIESLVLADFGIFLREDQNGIDLFSEIKGQKVVFIFLDSRRYGESAKSLGRILIRDIIATSARIDAEVAAIDRKVFTVMIDEFPDIAHEDFTAFPDRARSSKMCLVLGHQSMSDLDKVSDTFAKRLATNISSLYSFLQPVQESAEAVSSRAGTRTVYKETERTKRLLFWDLPTGDKSLREVEEFVIHPNTVKSLRVGECVVIKKYPNSRAYKIKVSLT